MKAEERYIQKNSKYKIFQLHQGKFTAKEK
jgi:hypothetical protein